MGKSKTTTNTVQDQQQTAAPPSWTAPGLVDAANLVTAGIGQIPTQHYSGPMVATMDPTQLQHITDAWGATAGNAGTLAAFLQGQLPVLNADQSFSTALPSTAYSLAPRQELDNVIRAAINPVRQQLTEQILPGITSSALASGAYSGDRAMGVLPTTAIRDAEDSMQRIAANLGYEDYQNYENRRLQAYGMQTQAAQQNYALDTSRQQELGAFNLDKMSALPNYVNSILHTQASQGDLLQMAAQLETAQRQAAIQNATGMDQYASQSPFMGLDTASQLLAMLSGRYGTDTMHGTSTSTQTTQQPLGMQILQGALGAAGLASGMGAFGGGGSLAGAGASPFSAASVFAPSPVSLPAATPMPSIPYTWPTLPRIG